MRGSHARLIAHVSSAHPYTDNRIHYRECRSLSEAGFDVQLIATESDFEGEATGVTVRKLPRRRRISRMTLSTLQAVRIALRTGARVVHLHDPELIPYIPLLRVMRRVVVYDAHEDLPTQVLDKPYVSRVTRLPMTWVTYALVSLARRADLVVAATETIAARFPASKTVLVRNYPPLRSEEEKLPPLDDRGDIVVYIGGLSRSRGIPEVLRAVREPEFPDGWELHLAGMVSADVNDLIQDEVARGRVKYHGTLPPLEARDLLLRAKVGIVTLQNTRAYRDSLPTKLFEYFAAGLPAVASDFPLWRGIIETGDAGTLVDEKSPAAIARAIAEYASNPVLWTRHSLSARKAAEAQLNWGREAQGLVEAYERMIAAV